MFLACVTFLSGIGRLRASVTLTGILFIYFACIYVCFILINSVNDYNASLE